MTEQLQLPHVHWNRRHGYYRYALCGNQLYAIHFTRVKITGESAGQLYLCQDNKSGKLIKMADIPVEVPSRKITEWAGFAIATHRLHLIALGRPIVNHPNQTCDCAHIPAQPYRA